MHCCSYFQDGKCYNGAVNRINNFLKNPKGQFIWISTYQTLTMPEKKKNFGKFRHPSILIIDEAHNLVNFSVQFSTAITIVSETLLTKEERDHQIYQQYRHKAKLNRQKSI